MSRINNYPNYAESLLLLQSFSTPDNVINHLILTAQTAMGICRILKEKNIEVNCDLILTGALLHDIGRCQSHEIDHALIGAKILRNLNFPADICQLVENHLLGGITRDEASILGLPEKDFLPITLEEKIVSYSDNVSKNSAFLTTEQVILKFRKYYVEGHPVLNRIKLLHEEIESLIK